MLLQNIAKKLHMMLLSVASYPPQLNIIREYLLENKILRLETASEQARALDTVQKSSESHKCSVMATSAAANTPYDEITLTEENTKNISPVSSTSSKFYFFATTRILESDVQLGQPFIIAKKGRFQRVCRPKTQKRATISATSAALNFQPLATKASKCLDKACTNIYISGESVQSFDSESCDELTHPRVIQHHQLERFKTEEKQLHR